MIRPVLVAGCLAAPLVLGGCSGAHDGAVREAASTFYDSVAAGDGAAACALLAARARSEVEQATQRSCDEGLLTEDLPEVARPDEVQVFGTMAQVRFVPTADGPGETVFLSRYDDGWRVTAAGCTPRGEDTAYDCQVSAG